MTNHTPTIRVLSNVGEEILMEAKIASTVGTNSADTIDISSRPEIQSGDTIKIISVNNITDGAMYSTFTYSASTRKFTMAGVADATLTASEIRIEFKKISA